MSTLGGEEHAVTQPLFLVSVTQVHTKDLLHDKIGDMCT